MRLLTNRLPALAGVLLVGLGAGTVAAQQVGSRVGDQAPVVTVNDLDGVPHDLGQYLGKVPVFLEFWATWCEQCEALMPHVRAVSLEYGDRVKFIGINIAVNQTPKRVRQFLEDHPVPFMTLFDNLGTSVRAFNVPTTSYVVVIDSDGIIRYVGLGGDQLFNEILDTVAPAQDSRKP